MEEDAWSQEMSLKLFLSGFTVEGEESSGKVGGCLVGRGRVKVHHRE
jgi:hypothetical protein